MTVIQANNIGALSQVTAAVHDQSFNPEWIHHEPSEGLVTVLFLYDAIDQQQLIARGAFWRKFSIPLLRGELRFQGVVDCSIDDRSGIGMYTMNRVRYDPERSQMILTTCEDLQIRLNVNEIHVACRISGDVVGYQHVYRLLGLVEYQRRKEIFLDMSVSRTSPNSGHG